MSLPTVKLRDLPIEWRRGAGLNRSDISDDGEKQCILYGELFTKHKSVLIEKGQLSKTNKTGKVVSKKGDVLTPATSTASRQEMILAREVGADDILLGGDINIIRPKEGVFAQKYLPYFFETPSAYSQLERYITGSTGIIHISNAGIKNLEVPLQSFKEQEKIVAKIEELFSELENAQNNAVEAEKLLPLYKLSVLSAAFTGKLTSNHDRLDSHLDIDILSKGLEDLPKIPNEWEYVKLKSIGDLARGKSKHRPRNDPKLFGGAYPFIQTGEVKAAKGEITKYSKTYNTLGLAQSKLWPKGTLCITIAANIAETAFLGIDACFPDSIVGFTPNETLVLPKYVRYFIDLSKDRIEQFAPATAQKNINLKTLEELVIPYCTLEEQSAIIDRIEQTLGYADTLIADIDNIKIQNKTAKQSILSKAFAGELV